MTNPTDLLQNSQAVFQAGTKPFGQRQVAKMAVGALVLSMGLFVAPSMAAKHAPITPSQSQQQMVNQIPAEVVKVEQVRSTRYERDVEQATTRGSRSMGNALGGVLGGLIGRSVDNRHASNMGQTLGSLVGELGGSKLMDWQQKRRAKQQANVQQVDDRIMVTVDVVINGEPQRYNIEQSAALHVKRGDKVMLVPDDQGGVRILPPEPTSTMRPR